MRAEDEARRPSIKQWSRYWRRRSGATASWRLISLGLSMSRMRLQPEVAPVLMELATASETRSACLSRHPSPRLLESSAIASRITLHQSYARSASEPRYCIYNNAFFEIFLGRFVRVTSVCHVCMSSRSSCLFQYVCSVVPVSGVCVLFMKAIDPAPPGNTPENYTVCTGTVDVVAHRKCAEGLVVDDYARGPAPP